MLSTLMYWHWLVIGMALLIAELFLGSMAILWFGLGAVAVAGLVLVAPGMGLPLQLFTWSLLSGLLTVLWFRFLKPRMADRTTAGIAREAIVGETGHVTSAPDLGRRGTVRFARPVLGSDEWPFICDDEVTAGDRVVVKDVSGNTLIVCRKS